MADRILVVDDEEPIRDIVSAMLTSAGYACKQASSGIEALAVLSFGEEFELMLGSDDGGPRWHWPAGAH
jgi:CheY-like chemotaxis protein